MQHCFLSLLFTLYHHILNCFPIDALTCQVIQYSSAYYIFLAVLKTEHTSTLCKSPYLISPVNVISSEVVKSLLHLLPLSWCLRVFSTNSFWGILLCYIVSVLNSPNTKKDPQPYQSIASIVFLLLTQYYFPNCGRTYYLQIYTAY